MQKTEAWIRTMEHYERFINGEISEEEFQAIQNVADNALIPRSTAAEHRDSHEKQYAIFRRLLLASSREIPISVIMDYIDKILVDGSKRIVIKWNM